MLSKKDIEDVQDLKTETLHVPEWGGDVMIRELSGHARSEYEKQITNKDGSQNLTNWRAKMVMLSLVDEKGRQMFNEAEVMKLGKKSANALDRIVNAALALNEMAAESVEELAKN